MPLYSFLHQPELFNNYIILSFNPSFGKEVTFEYLQTFLETYDDVSANVFLGVGSEEESEEFPAVSGLLKVENFIKQKGYKSLKLTKKILEGVDHCGVTAPLFQTGLQTVFSDYPKKELW